MDSSDTDTEVAGLSTNTRLGLCEVCNQNNAKYSCPKCEVKTCKLECLNIHKKELNCSGIRDKTKFLSLKEMTPNDFMNDYYFLEDCTRYVSDRKRDYLKQYTRFNKHLPTKDFKLRAAAKERGTIVKFLLKNFKRNKSNTSFYSFSEKIIYWKIDWIFPNAENLLITEEKCSENEKLIDLIDKYFNSTDSTAKNLMYYQSRGVDGVKFLLKAEFVKKCKNRYFELELNKTLRENFNGKTLIEFPSIYVVFNDVIDGFDVIDSDVDIDLETKTYQQELELKYGKNAQSSESTSSNVQNENIEERKSEEEVRVTMEHLEIEKKEDRPVKKAIFKVEPRNFLFADENKSSSDSEDSDETVEELLQPPPMKKIKTEYDSGIDD